MNTPTSTLRTELAAEREKSERYRLASLKLDVELVVMKARAENAEAELAVSESERMEQARLLGKSGSREAALLAEMAAMNSEFGKMLLSASERGDRNVQLKRRADKAKADTARLDWLSVSDIWFDIPASGTFTPETMRAAIDAAMKEDSK